MVNKKLLSGSGPLYLQIANYVRDKIYDRSWQSGHKLPSEFEFCKQFGASRGTVRRALQILIDEGMLVSHHGLGSFVADKALAHPAGVRPLSFAESLKRQGKEFTTRVFTQEVIPATPEIALHLKIEAETLVLHLLRVKYVEGEPLICQDSYLNLVECPGLEAYDFMNISAFDAVQETAKRPIQNAFIHYSARVAGDVYAKLLGVEVSSPVLVLEQEISLSDKKVIEWSFTWLKAGQEIIGVANQS